MINPPTNNLYKFMSIFGLVLIVTSVWGAYQSLYEYALRSIETKAFFAVHQAELFTTKDREINILREMLHTNDRDKLERLQGELRSTNDNVPLAVPEYEKHLDIDRLYADKANTLLIVALVLGVLGMVLSGLGFYLWYSRLQILLDAQLRKDAASK